MGKWTRMLALCLAVLLVAPLALSGCGEEERPVVYLEDVLPKNDGQPARLVVETPAGLDGYEGMQAVLEEIVRKYRADFPNTEIELRTLSPADGNDADIRLVTDSGKGTQAESLLDLSQYAADAWSNEGSLTTAASFVMRYMGKQGIYAVPIDVRQDLLFYRTDWVESYNQGKAWAEMAGFGSWDQTAQTVEKLGDQGRLAVSSDKIGSLFDAVMWSKLGVQAASAPYYVPRGKEATTIFTAGKAPEALAVFDTLMSSVPDDGYPDEDAAVRAFIDGGAGLLVADAAVAEQLGGAMPEGSWKAVGLPLGSANGSAVVPCRWLGWGVSRLSEEPEKAAHFLAYLTNADNNTYLAKTCGTLPLYREATEMEPSLLEGARATEIALLKEASYRYSGVPRCMEDFCGEDQAFAEELEDYLAGKMTGGELLERLDARGLQALDSMLPGWLLPWLTEEDLAKLEEKE